MKINGIAVTQLRNDEHFQFHTEFRKFVQKETAEKLKIEGMFNAYLPLYEREDEVLKMIRKSSLTEKIHEADIARDKVYTTTLDLIKAMCKHFNPVIADAAVRIKIVFDTYGNIAKKSLNEQTSAIYNLLQELDLPKYTDDRINTQINPFLNELKNCNERLEALTEKRYDETGSRSDIVPKDAREELDKQYRTIIEFINAYLIVQGVMNPAELSGFEHFVHTFNAVVSKFSAIIHARLHHKHSHNHGEEEAEDENDE